MINNNYVLTSEGFKEDASLLPKDFTYNRTGRHSRVVSQNIVTTSPTSFTTIKTELDDIPIILRSDKKVFTVDLVSFEKLFKRTIDLTEDHWVFSPWVTKEMLSPKLTFDLAKCVDNHHDSFNIYLFNNEILEIADKLDIPFYAVKELLIREAAEFSDYLNKLKYYLYTQYNIVENPSEINTSFPNFKKYVLENHVFKMQRYLQVDKDFIAFLVSSLTKASFSQNTYNKNNRYKISYKFKKEDNALVKQICNFLQKTNVKYTINEYETFVEVYNKPLYKLVTEIFMKDLSFIFNLEDSLYNYFLDSLFKTSQEVHLPLKVLLQLKQAYLYRKEILSIKDAPLKGYVGRLVKKDSLTTLENVVVIEEEGYFTKISELNTSIQRLKYSFITTEDQEQLLINCLVRG